MNIAIDIRSLQSGQVSGVENYTAHLTEHLLRADSQNRYTLFYNSLIERDFEQLHFINSKIVNIGLPNKLLNFGNRFLRRPNFERYIGKQDIVFFPNYNHYVTPIGAKEVITIHDLSAFIHPEFFDAKRRLWHNMLGLRKKLHSAHKIVAVSEYTKFDCMRVFGIPEDKISVIYPGVIPVAQEFSIEKLRNVRNKYHLPGNFILFVSTLEPRKNILGLIESFERLETQTHLVIAGKAGWKYEDIFKAIQNSPKSRFIHYLGYVPESDKSCIMKLSQVVAYPSFYEGFGFVPLEACALGVPVLACQVTSIPEVVGDAALLVDPYDTNAISFALTQLLSDETLRQCLIDKGKERVKKFVWESSAAAHLALFKNISE